MASRLTAPALLVLLGLAAGAGRAAAEGAASSSFPLYQPEAAPAVSRSDFGLLPPSEPGAAAYFRFGPEAPWTLFDRPLRLGAAPREDRAYGLEVAVEGPGGRRETAYRFRIDKLPPAPPRASPSQGVLREAVAVSLSAEAGSSLRCALLGPGSAELVFEPYDPSRRPVLRPPASGTETVVLLAYAVDEAGNGGEPSRFVYRLAASGLGVAEPPAQAPRLPPRADPLPELAATLVAQEAGRSVVSVEAPESAAVLAAVNPRDPLADAAAYAPLQRSGGKALLVLECPYGYSGEARVHLAVQDSSGLRARSEALFVPLAHRPEAARVPAPPEGPSLIAGPPGSGALVAFPAADGELYVSMAGSPFRPYSQPLSLPPGEGSVELRWYGVSAGGKSETASALLKRPAAIPDIGVLGAPSGAATREAVRLRPSGPGTLRYELSSDGSVPPEPGPASPLLGQGLLVECPEGEERSYAFRFRPFAGEAPDAPAGEGGLLAFALDRRPPPAPRLDLDVSSYASSALEIGFADSGGRVYASVSEEGREEPFMPVEGRLSLPGSDRGPVEYRIRAYALDEAGNRSAEMEPRRFLVDKTTIYADSAAGAAGDGSPDRPYRSLEDAIGASLSSGRSLVRLRGKFALGRPLRLGSRLVLSGGYGPAWERLAGERALVDLLPSAFEEGGPAILVEGGSLSLEGVELAAALEGSGVLVSLSGASLNLEGSRLRGRARGDLVLVEASASRIRVSASTLGLEEARSGAALVAADSEAAFSGSKLSAAEGLRYFSGLDLERGSLLLEDSVLSSRAALGSSLLSLKDAELRAERCLFEGKGGSGFFLLGRLADCRGLVANSRAEISWDGDVTLFELSGVPPAFVHDSFILDGRPGASRFFDAKGRVPRIRNSILQAPAGGAVLLRSTEAPLPGDLAANCLWGFDDLVAGSLAIRGPAGLAALNALNVGDAALAAKPNIEEAPASTFGEPLKGIPRLRAGSACVDGALPLEGFEADFRGGYRPGPAGPGAPDIGADEFRE